jgi:hypothetical protein
VQCIVTHRLPFMQERLTLLLGIVIAHGSDGLDTNFRQFVYMLIRTFVADSVTHFWTVKVGHMNQDVNTSTCLIIDTAVWWLKRDIAHLFTQHYCFL